MSDDPFNPTHLRIDPTDASLIPAKIRKRHQHFVLMPYSWVERLAAGLS
jgi:hypothetical protein